MERRDGASRRRRGGPAREAVPPGLGALASLVDEAGEAEDGEGGGDAEQGGDANGDVEHRRAQAELDDSRGRRNSSFVTCHIPGCGAVLSSSDPSVKRSNMRYRICQDHMRAQVVTAGDGTAQRWCHKCSRLHELSAFTQGRRTCAKVLKNLVARRRHASEAQAASPAYEAATAHLSPRQLAARQRHRQQPVQQMAQPHAFYGGHGLQGLMPGLLYPHVHPAGAPHMNATSMQVQALLSSVLSMAPQLAGAWMQQALMSGGQPPQPQPQPQQPSGTQPPDLTRILGDLLAAQPQSSAARGAGTGPAQPQLGVMSLTGLPFAMAAPSMLYAQPAQMMPPPPQPQQQQGDFMQGLQQLIQQSQQQYAQAQTAASAQAAAASGAGAAAPAPGGGGAVASVLPDSLLRSLMGRSSQATPNPPP